MTIAPASASALLGIQRGLRGMEHAAAKIAGAATQSGEAPHDETTRALLGVRTERLHIAASAAIARADDRARGALLDVFA